MHQRFFRLTRLGLLAFAAVASLLSVSAQADIIAPDSTYSARVAGGGSGNSNFLPITFDGLWESFTRTTADGNEITVRINETQTYLGNSRHLIEISLFSTGDLFPVGGEGGFLGIGGLDPLDLLGPVAVESAFLAFYIGDTLLADGDFYPTFSAYFSNPWDGGFLNAANAAAGWVPVGALGVDGIRLRITTRPVPVPAPFALLGLGVVALLAQRRRNA